MGHPLVVAIATLVVALNPHHHVVGLVGPVGALVGWDVGDSEQDVGDFGQQGVALGGQGHLLDPQGPAPLLQVRGLVGLPFLVESAHLPGDGLDLVANPVPSLGGLPLPGVGLEHPVERAGVLAPAGDGRLDTRGVPAQKSEVDHGPEPSLEARPALRRYCVRRADGRPRVGVAGWSGAGGRRQRTSR